jgi:hypothetical protein
MKEKAEQGGSDRRGKAARLAFYVRFSIMGYGI